MKQKGMIAIGVIISALLAAAFFFRPREEFVSEIKMDEAQGGELELLALIKDEMEAKTIAEGYGIEFVSWAEGVAVFRTEKTFEEILRIGQEKSLPELSVNIENEAFVQ